MIGHLGRVGPAGPPFDGGVRTPPEHISVSLFSCYAGAPGDVDDEEPFLGLGELRYGKSAPAACGPRQKINPVLEDQFAGIGNGLLRIEFGIPRNNFYLSPVEPAFCIEFIHNHMPGHQGRLGKSSRSSGVAVKESHFNRSCRQCLTCGKHESNCQDKRQQRCRQPTILPIIHHSPP